MMVDTRDLVTIRQIIDIIGDDVESKDLDKLLRRWRDVEHLPTIRTDLALFEWSRVRPILAERFGLPPSKWSGVRPNG